MTKRRSEKEIARDYQEYRGLCKKLCDLAIINDPTLRLARGHIFVHLWPTQPKQDHWWCVRQDGTIYDPSWKQFPFQAPPPDDSYTEFDGTVECAQCHKQGKEEDFETEGRYSFCSTNCYGLFVGIDPEDLA